MAEIILRDAIAKGVSEALDHAERVFLMGDSINTSSGPHNQIINLLAVNSSLLLPINMKR